MTSPSMTLTASKREEEMTRHQLGYDLEMFEAVETMEAEWRRSHPKPPKAPWWRRIIRAMIRALSTATRNPEKE